MTDFDTDDHSSVPEHLLESTSLLSKKWHAALIRSIADGDGPGFSDLESRLDGISAKVLTDALDDLQDNDIVERTEVSQQPLRVEYTLTPRGHDLDTVLQSLADWGEQYLQEPDEEQVVLVADDNRQVATMHTTWLAEEYTVRTAHDGEQALQELDEDVDVAVLDRRMPGLTGDEVLDWIRSQRYDCRVVVITAEDVDLDVATMGFDEYLTKPVLREQLHDVVESLLDRAELEREHRQYLALQSKVALLEAELSSDALAASDSYQRLTDRLDAMDPEPEDVDAESASLERMRIRSNQ
jgi:DNA-binding HxlR family transcriptional regulator/DNA-binding NarL/FixJ family response regulator